MLKAGLCYEAMIDMTGLPFEKIYFRDEETQELIRWGGVGWEDGVGLVDVYYAS